MKIIRYSIVLFICLISAADILSQWVKTSAPETGAVISICASKDGSIYAANHIKGVFISSDNGTTWTAMNNGLPVDSSLTCMAIGETDVFAGTVGGGVFVSSDNGTSWKSANKGITGTSIIAPDFARNGKTIFVATFGGVFKSDNYGEMWSAVNEGLTGYKSKTIYSLATAGDFLFAGTDSCGIWRRPLSEVTPVSNTGSIRHTPMQVYVRQGSLFMKYAVESATLVRIGVYTVSGRLVALLADKIHTPGAYTVTSAGRSIPAGMYVCRYQAGSSIETQRILVSE